MPIYDPLQYAEINEHSGWAIVAPEEHYARLRITTPDRDILIPLLANGFVNSSIPSSSFSIFWKGQGYSDDTVAAYASCLDNLSLKPLHEFICTNNGNNVISTTRSTGQGALKDRKSNQAIRNAKSYADALKGSMGSGEWLEAFADQLGLPAEEFVYSSISKNWSSGSSNSIGTDYGNAVGAYIMSCLPTGVLFVLSIDGTKYNLKSVKHISKQICFDQPLIWTSSNADHLNGSQNLGGFENNFRGAIRSYWVPQANQLGDPLIAPNEQGSYGVDASLVDTKSRLVRSYAPSFIHRWPELTENYKVLSTPSVYNFRVEVDTEVPLVVDDISLPNGKIIKEFVVTGGWAGVATHVGLAVDRLKLMNANTEASSAITEKEVMFKASSRGELDKIMNVTSCSAEPFLSPSKVRVEDLQLYKDMKEGKVDLKKEILMKGGDDQPDTTWSMAESRVHKNKMYAVVATPGVTNAGENSATIDHVYTEPSVPPDYASTWKARFIGGTWKAWAPQTETLPEYISNYTLTPKEIMWIELKGTSHRPVVDRAQWDADLNGSWGMRRIADVSSNTDADKSNTVDIAAFMVDGYLDWRGLSLDAQRRMLLLVKGCSTNIAKMEAQLIHTLDVASKSYGKARESLKS